MINGFCVRSSAGLAAAVVSIAGGASTARAQWTVTNLHPAGATNSYASGASGTRQVGFAGGGGPDRGGLWSGTAASWVDLSASLTGSWGDSYAEGIWSDGATTSIAGYGFNNATGRTEALLWTRPIAAPCYANCDGSTTAPILNIADFTCFLQKYAAQDPYANCDQSTTPPVLNIADFTSFLQKYAAKDPYANCDGRTTPSTLSGAHFTCFLQEYSTGCS